MVNASVVEAALAAQSKRHTAQCTMQMDSVSGIREEGGCEIGAVGGAMEVGLRFRGLGEGSFRGEGDLAPTRYEWGQPGEEWNHVLRTHLSEM